MLNRSGFDNESIYKIIDIVNASIYWKDLDGYYLGCNKYVLTMAGLQERSELIGKTDYDLAWKDEAPKLRAIDESVAIKGVYIGEESFPIANGEVKTYLTTKKQMLDSEGKVMGIIGTSLDITSQKKKEELEKQKVILDEKIKVLQLMGGAVAHELRTPLATISLAAQAVESILPKLFEAYHVAIEHKLIEPITNPARFKLMETVFENIKKEVNASNVFINNMLLNIQNLAADPKDMEILSMKACIEKALSRYPFDERSHSFTQVKMKHNFLFRGMPVLMQHVIFNLLRNGIYYVLESIKDDAGITIWTEKGKDGWNELHFKDTGTGITEEHMEHIFERFFSKRYHGTGVGLAFCKQVITQFGGTINCTSKKGEYTHFVMRFPPVDEQQATS
jgi:PAS domain S-box-containing protein